MTNAKNRSSQHNRLPKAPTGINGLDEITGGGLPKGRPTLVAGNAGCGKTLLAMELLVRDALDYNEPGFFVCFKEPQQYPESTFSSHGYNLPGLLRSKKLAIEYAYIERSEIEETGAYDVEGMVIRLAMPLLRSTQNRSALIRLKYCFRSLHIRRYKQCRSHACRPGSAAERQPHAMSRRNKSPGSVIEAWPEPFLCMPQMSSGAIRIQ